MSYVTILLFTGLHYMFVLENVCLSFVCLFVSYLKMVNQIYFEKCHMNSMEVHLTATEFKETKDKGKSIYNMFLNALFIRRDNLII